METWYVSLVQWKLDTSLGSFFLCVLVNTSEVKLLVPIFMLLKFGLYSYYIFRQRKKLAGLG